MRSLRVLCKAVDYLSRGAASTSSHIPLLQKRQIHSSTRLFDEKDVPEARHEDFITQVEALRPSDSFQAGLSREQTETYKNIWKEIELFVYLGKYIPRYIDGASWSALLKSESVGERVSFLEYLAQKQRREERERQREQSSASSHREWLDQQKQLFDNGAMGYGPDMYTLLTSPFRQQKKIRHHESNKIVAAMRAGEPTVALDLQFLAHEQYKVQKILGRQVQYVISENFEARNPLPLAFFNSPKTDEGKKWFSKAVGFYKSEYQHQTVLPECSELEPKLAFPEAKRIIYISRYAREMLDGPINNDVLCVGVTYDQNRNTLGAARKSRIRPMALPIQKYVKWQSGPMNLPLPNVLRVLRHVNETGGDWRTALLNNISKRHLQSDEERKENGSEFRAMIHQRRLQEREDLVNAIQDATR